MLLRICAKPYALKPVYECRQPPSPEDHVGCVSAASCRGSAKEKCKIEVVGGAGSQMYATLVS